jgi:rfaE bifunctional protein nucleotidyltransferase chain/domain
MKKKIKSEREIIKIVKKLKKEKKKIVATSGSFDLLHFGHIAALYEAKKKGDMLIVLLNSDSSIKMCKGKGKPIFPEDIRAKVLSALEPVDYVTIFNEITPIKILEKIKPDIYCQGEEWGKNCIERAIVEKYGEKYMS